MACPKDLPQIYVAIAPSDPRRLYATLCADRARGRLGVYRSDDGGENWAQITTIRAPQGASAAAIFPVPRVDPKNPDLVYVASTVTMRSTDGGKTWIGISRRARRRRLPEPLDQSRQPQHYSAGQRSGRSGHREWRRDLEFLVQPADGAALPRHCRQFFPLPRLRGAAGERLRLHFHPRQRRRDHFSRMASGRRDRIWLCGARSAAIPTSSTARAATKFRNFIGPPAKCRTSRRSRCAIRNTAPTAPSRSMFSPVDPHMLYYATNVLFKTTDGGNSWQTISPDLTREHPGHSSQRWHAGAKDRRRQTARRDLCARALVQDAEHHLGGHRRRPDLDHERRRKKLDRHHSARTDRVEQGHADFASHFDDQTRTLRSAGFASTTCILISTARTMAARPGS